MTAALASLLDQLPPLTLIVGKGGVGKTTTATGLAAHLAGRHCRTLLLSTDPALALADEVGQALTPSPRAIAGRPGLHAIQLSAQAARQAFLSRWRDTIVTIVDRGTYLDLDDIAGLVDAAFPGADEIFALLELARLTSTGAYDRIIADTAPTGHTLRLLALPETFRALVALLDAMQGKHRFMVEALTHRYRADAADAFIAEMRRTLDDLRATLTDPTRGGAVLVCRPESVVAAESSRLASSLAALGVHVRAVLVNAVSAAPDEAERATLAALADLAGTVPHYVVRRAAEPPLGIEACAALVSAASTMTTGGAPRPAPKRAARRARRRRRGEQASFTLPASLLIVGGKGGVGKTTTSCALAIAAADAGRRVLLVSTDPAPSIADALDQSIGDREAPVAGVPTLVARQIDASAAFARFRDEYQSRIDALFDALVSRGLDVAHDRAILRDLLALAPPGIDELYALASLGETLADERFDFVVIDPAPTGHLLRMLEIPAVALDWSHRLMRLMLKYREVGGLGDAAEELLAFAKRTRAVGTLLHDGTRAGVAVVSLDEPLVRAETARLIESLRALDMAVIGVLWNRVGGDPTPLPLPTHPPVRQLVAPAAAPAPIGVAELRAWSAQWTELTTRNG